MNKTLLLIGAMALLAGAGIAPAETWDAVSNFPTSPALPAVNSPWSYGYSNTLTPFVFTPDTASTTDYFGNGSGIVGYYSPLNGAFLPTVLANTTASPFTIASITNWDPSLLLLHPGESGTQGEYSIVRFTAPDTATYNVEAVFQGLDSVGPTNTSNTILVNGDAIYASVIHSYGVPSDVPETLSLNAGDTVDFAVGFAGQNYNNDSTGFNATISETPEPGTMGLLVSSLAGLGLMARRRRSV
jgi:hypothetical protein